MKKNEFSKITELLPAGWEEAAKETGAFTRSRKIKNPEELLRLNLLYLTNGGSFGKPSAMLKLTQENSLHKNAVYERILKSANWLQWLCQNLCRKEGFLAPLPQWLENRRVCLVDASDESKPGSKGADYRLHDLVELFQLSMIEMHLTSEKEGEKISRYSKIQKGDIILGDRAYGTLKGISYVRDKEADYVFRLRANAFKLYKKSGEELFLSDAFNSLKASESKSLSCFYKEGNVQKPIRICAIRKSKEAQEKGIRQIKKSNSKRMRGKVSPLLTKGVFSLRENKEKGFPQETSLWMEVRVIFELLAYLILFTYEFEKGLSRLGKLLESCSNSKRKRLPAFYRFLLKCV